MDTPLLEYVAHRGTLSVDSDAGVIKGVRVLGLESANGRTYTREAVSAALPLYEGKQVNIDHPQKSAEQTSVARRFGWLESVVQESDGGLRANLHYLKSHPLAAPIVEAAQRRPQLLGLSHNAQGNVKRVNGRDVIEAISAVHSVDLVADPATVAGLHESRNIRMKKTLREWIAELKASRPEYARGLQEQADSGVMAPDAPMDEPPAAGEADHETALKQGFRAAILACLDDEGLDLKAKVNKIKDILKMEEKMLSKGDAPADSGGGDGGPPAAEESRRLKLEVAGLKLLLEAGVKASKVLTKALSACTSEAEMKALIEEAKATRPGAKSAAPGAATPPDTSVQEALAPVGDTKALGKWLRG